MYCLQNESIKLQVNALGAELQDVQHRHHGQLLWIKDDAIWNRVSPILFPFVGRLLHDQYKVNGKVFSIRQHGFARDLVFDLVLQNDESLIFSLIDNEATRKHYPFGFELQVIYSLKGQEISITHRVINRDNKPLLFSIGGHPGFQINGKISDYSLDFGGEYTVQQHLITGNFYNGKTKDLHLNRTFDLSESLFASDAIVIKSPPFKSISFGKKNGPLYFTLHCDSWTAVGLWTKPGAPFFCIEPWWGWADSLDSDGNLENKAGILTIDPNEQQDFSYSIVMH